MASAGAGFVMAWERSVRSRGSVLRHQRTATTEKPRVGQKIPDASRQICDDSGAGARRVWQNRTLAMPA